MTAAVRFEGVSKAFALLEPHERTTTIKRWLSDVVTLRRRGPRRMHRALDQVSFEVARGETVGILGRNGSGKSTILRLTARIYRPDAGRVTVRGRVAPVLELGGGFHPEFTGRQNVVLEGVMLGLSRAEIRRRMERIVEFADLGEYVDQPVRTYSTGMFMRLAFAVAIQVEPDVLLLDEVLAVGDEAFVEKCRSALESLRARGTTILLVTHDLDALARWCDRALWIDEGRIRRDGGPGEVAAVYHRAMSAVPANPGVEAPLDAARGRVLAHALMFRPGTSETGP